MLVNFNKTSKKQYTAITELDGAHSSMLMNFGLLNLDSGDDYTINTDTMETALLLLSGEAELNWADEKAVLQRNSLIDELPTLLHIPCNTPLRIDAKTNAEFAVQQTVNKQHFEATLYQKQQIRNEFFGAGTMQDTSTRNVRTIFDADNAPYSNMVIGEVVNYPGKWSSYPPHNHPQPEIYHYRFFPEHGFGFGEAGDTVYKLRHKSTLLIDPWVTHPQCAAPGYVMYYIWMIPHLPNAKFGPDSRNFIEEHSWLLNKDAEIWTPAQQQ